MPRRWPRGEWGCAAAVSTIPEPGGESRSTGRQRPASLGTAADHGKPSACLTAVASTEPAALVAMVIPASRILRIALRASSLVSVGASMVSRQRSAASKITNRSIFAMSPSATWPTVD
jgi:hypothetical protein